MLHQISQVLLHGLEAESDLGDELWADTCRQLLVAEDLDGILTTLLGDIGHAFLHALDAEFDVVEALHIVLVLLSVFPNLLHDLLVVAVHFRLQRFKHLRKALVGITALE